MTSRRVCRRLVAVWTAGFVVTLVGCTNSQYATCVGERDKLRAALETSQKDVAKAQAEAAALRSQIDASGAQVQALKAKVSQASGGQQSAQQSAAALQQKIAVLQADRAKKQELYMKLLGDLKAARMHAAPIPPVTRNRLKEFGAATKGFTFDENRGVSKFQADILFDEGKADVKPTAAKTLAGFAEIFKSKDAKDLNLLVIGHTDDQRIVLPSTKANHPTNWHLSVHRAIQVLEVLQKAGIKPERMGVSGYGEYQPVVPNTGEANRQKNRRVEIYVVQSPVASESGG